MIESTLISGLTRVAIVIATGTIAVSGAIFLIRRSNPYRSKPVPSIDTVVQNIKNVAQFNENELYQVVVDIDDSDYDKDCFYDGMYKIKKFPDSVHGNLYHAVLTLHDHLYKQTKGRSDYIEYLYHQTVEAWDPQKESFMEAFHQIITTRDCLYLRKPVTL